MTINISNKLLVLLAGTGIGTVIGMLIAPQSGEQLRENLTGRVNDLTGMVQDKVKQSGIAGTATSTVRDVMERGKNVVNMGKERLNESIEAGKKKFNESIESEDRGDFGDLDIASR